MQNLATKAMVFVPLAAIGVLVTPYIMSWQGKSKLREEFTPALARFDAIRYAGEADAETHTVKWGEISSVSASDLPSIRGGVFIMRPSRDVFRLNSEPDREPASIDAAFFELDEATRAASPGEIRTVVHLYPTPRRLNYGTKQGGATMALMTKMIVRLNIYDLEDKALLGTWVLEGKSPPARIDKFDIPNVPGPPITEFLEMLPRH